MKTLEYFRHKVLQLECRITSTCPGFLSSLTHVRSGIGWHYGLLWVDAEVTTVILPHMSSSFMLLRPQEELTAYSLMQCFSTPAGLLMCSFVHVIVARDYRTLNGKMKFTTRIIAAICALEAVSAQQVSRDPIGIGPTPELMHLYYDEWPTGREFLVSSSPRRKRAS
jgi:hypothetical protein